MRSMGHAIYHPAHTNQEAFFQNRGRSRRPRATAGEWVRDQSLFRSWLNKEGALLGRAGLLSPSFLLASSIPGPGSPRVALRLRKWQHTLRGRNTNADNGHERAEGGGRRLCTGAESRWDRNVFVLACLSRQSALGDGTCSPQVASYGCVRAGTRD